LAGSFSPRIRRRSAEYKFANGVEPGTLSNAQTMVNAYGKISFSNGRVNAALGALWTPTYSDGSFPATTASAGSRSTSGTSRVRRTST
jgi:hypothetical protein